MHAEVGDTAGILAALVRIRVFDCLDRLIDCRIDMFADDIPICVKGRSPRSGESPTNDEWQDARRRLFPPPRHVVTCAIHVQHLRLGGKRWPALRNRSTR